MSRDPFASYDAWLEEPYQRQQAQDPGECPECGHPLVQDRHERTVDCEACGFHNGYDWDSEAERRAEARAEAREARYDF